MKTKYLLRLGLLLCCIFVVAGAQAQRTVTMRLNMASVPDTINGMGLIEVRGAGGATGSVAPDTLADGNIIDWSAASTLEPVNEKGPNGEDSDYWSLSFMIDETDSLQHKFYSDQLNMSLNAGWEADPNPYIEPGTGDVDLGLHFFEAQIPWHGVSQRRAGGYNWLPWEPKTDSVAVWYRVAMFGLHSEDRGYDAAMMAPDQIVGVRGAPIDDGAGAVGPLNWGASQVVLDRESMDEATAGYSIYSGVAYYPAALAGMNQDYKFVLEHGDTVGWEEGNVVGNRSFTVPASDTTLHWMYYGNTAPSKVVPVEGQVVFGVDMSAFETIGVFDTARNDTLWVFGDFNGWQGCRDEQRLEECYMFKEPGGTNFAAAVPLTRPPGWSSGYKYFLDFNDVEFEAQFGEEAPSGWEEGHRTGINRQFDFAGDPDASQILSLSYFNDVTPMNVMMDGDETEVMFSLTMQQAIDSQAQPFNPATDSVSIHLGDPIWAFTQGLGVEQMSHNIPLWDAVLLTDSDGDGTYTGTYTVKGPSYNILTFRYMYGGKSMSTQEMGSDTRVPGRNRVHFIPKNADGSFQAQYELPVHEFNLMPGPLPHDNNPYITNTGIEQSEEIPTNIWLGENYPNPFNPTTTIEYGLEQQAHVQLHVYDMLGRRVATLVDGLQQAATYTITFDASRLASGIYLYRLETPHRAYTKRMMLIK